jgi:hypothetical protein
MTNQDLINKLNQFPKDKHIVFFCNQDVVGQEFVWNECWVENIKECLYIEYNYKIYFSTDDLKDYLLDYRFMDEINKIIENIEKKEVIRIDLNIT